MTLTSNLIPTGPAEGYLASDDLLRWMLVNFEKYGDIYSTSICGTPAYVVSDLQHVDYILRVNWQNYRKGYSIKRIGLLLGNGLMVSEGEFWKSQRRMVQPAFHHEVIGALLGMITKANSALLDKWLCAANEKANINATHDISNMVLTVTLKFLFSDDYDAVASYFNVLSNEQARDMHFLQLFRPLRNVVSEIIAARRSSNRTCIDVLSMLMETRDRESGRLMPDGQVVSEIMTLIVAGHETTASTLSWIWHLLSEYPEVEKKLVDEVDGIDWMIDSLRLEDLPKFVYMRQVIEEVMRLYPPGWLLIRRALHDDHLGDYFVPSGTEVYISPYLIQRNPALWDHPNQFDPDRFGPQQSHDRHPLATFPFSAGPRKCIGELLARVEMQLHLMIIAPHLRLRQISGNPTKLEAGVNLRCKDDFIMIPEIRTGASAHEPCVA